MVEVVERARDGSVFAPMACDGAASGECGRFSTSADMVNEAERQRGKKRGTEKQSFLARAQAENLVLGFPRVLSLLRGKANLVSLRLSLEGESVHWIPGPAIQLGQIESRAPRTRGEYNNKLSGCRVASCRPPLTSSREWRGGYLGLSGQAQVQASMEETRNQITEPDGAVGLLWLGAEDPRRTRTQGFWQPESAKT